MSDRDRERLDWAMRQANKTMRERGNEGRFTQQDLQKHCERLLERNDRKADEHRKAREEKERKQNK